MKIRKVELKLNEKILESGVKKKRIAQLLEINPNTLSKYLKGERKIPFEYVIYIAEIIGYKVEDLYEREDAQ